LASTVVTGNQPKIGFIGAPDVPASNNPSYPPPYPGNNLPYPPSNLPVNNQPIPSTSTATYPPYQQNSQQYPPSAPYAPYAAIPPNVHTSQPTANTVIIQEQKLSSGNCFIRIYIN
jgi:hypothetical protein